MFFKTIGVAVMLFFAHDCDKTVVYYDEADQATASGSPMSMALPASATGKVGYVHKSTLDELANIAEDGTEIICVSGARGATMATRQPYFPMISWWICENGGRIFKASPSGESMEELETYKDHVNSMTSPEHWRALELFASNLQKEGWKVDRESYVTMIRISKGSIRDGDVTSLEARIPPELQHTYNLGHLDVQLPGLGKKRSVEWLIDAITKETHGSDHASEYLFFGDDDNDIEALSGAKEAFLAVPHSRAVGAWLEEWRQAPEGSSAQGRPQKVTVPPDGVEGHDGAVFLLQRARASLRDRRSRNTPSDGI